MKTYNVTPSLEEMPRILKDFPNCDLKLDTELRMHSGFIPLLESGKKTTTVRYAKRKIRFPSGYLLRLIETCKDNKDYRKEAGTVKLSKLVVKTIYELNEDDGRRDGFSGKAELIGELEKIYGKINQDEFVSIYHIQLNKEEKTE